jgi:hypothetical protein
MKKPLLILALAAGFGSCQQNPTTSSNPATAEAPAAGPVADTEAGARAAVQRYLSGQSNANLYVLDSASFVEVNAQWQVLVPRTDWAGRMPNKAAFEVDKLTGEVRPLAVK